MNLKFILVSIILVIIKSKICRILLNECNEFEYLEQKMDNFKQDSTDKYLQWYIISKTHWTRNSPIFIYTRNEDDIEWFCQNTGFVWEIAEQFKKMIIFAEHRYYGKSMPYGDKSFFSPYII